MTLKRKLFRLTGALMLLAILSIVILFRYVPNRPVLQRPDGRLLFGYDDKQGKWLINEYAKYDLGIDGPYVFYKNNAVEIVSVRETATGLILFREDVRRVPSILPCVVDNTTKNVFSVNLQNKLMIPPCVYSMPKKLLVISDIEGYLKGFVELLAGNKVIDKNLHWVYGTGHLVLTGDFMDRGENVTQCLWLIYQLEQEAEYAGGKVHFILGNHEQLNMQGIAEYSRTKYRELVRRLNMPYKMLYAANTELGRWLRTKNVIEKIGETLFMHGGINPEIANLGLPPEQINNICRDNIDKSEEQITGKEAELLLGRKGILWYRGLVQNYKDYKKLSEVDVNMVLQKTGTKMIVIGHTIVDNVTADYHGKVLRTDVKHNEAEPQALFMENGKFYKTNTKGELSRL